MGANSRRERPRRDPDVPTTRDQREQRDRRERSTTKTPGRAGPAKHDRNVASGRGRGVRERGEATRDTLWPLLHPMLDQAGFDLEDLVVSPVGRRRLVRVVVDADGGVGLDDVAMLSERVSAVLDTADAMGTGPYVLEVTSPGVERPLTEPRHWRRAAGRLVHAPLTAGGEITGRVVTADDHMVVFDVQGEQRRLGLAELGNGRVQVEFRRDDGGG